MLSAKSISFAYDVSHKFTFPDISLSMAEDLLILGKSGVGKTTLVHILAGLLTPQSGKVELNNTCLNDLTPTELDKFRGRNIGMIFQKPHFVRNLSVLNNLMLSLYLANEKQDTQRAKQILAHIGLGKKLNSKPYTLSQGEQQRAAIALAVVKNPSLILADEPTSSLDDENCDIIIKLLKEQAKSTQAQLIIITHDHRLKKEFNKSISL